MFAVSCFIAAQFFCREDCKKQICDSLHQYYCHGHVHFWNNTHSTAVPMRPDCQNYVKHYKTFSIENHRQKSLKHTEDRLSKCWITLLFRNDGAKSMLYDDVHNIWLTTLSSRFKPHFNLTISVRVYKEKCKNLSCILFQVMVLALGAYFYRAWYWPDKRL